MKGFRRNILVFPFFWCFADDPGMWESFRLGSRVGEIRSWEGGLKSVLLCLAMRGRKTLLYGLPRTSFVEARTVSDTAPGS
jgi:hypothetical protein